MRKSLRASVRERAGNRCEYCGFPDSPARIITFHIEHIIATQHGGSDDDANLAWSCQSCNYHKGPNLSGIDPLTENIVVLFHPRRQAWSRHFEYLGAVVVGKTQTGRATVAVLDMNDSNRVKMRELAFHHDG